MNPLEQAINNLVATYLQGMLYGLGGIVLFVILYTFALDYLRKRAAESQKIWRNL